jgi:hypothetical protein
VRLRWAICNYWTLIHGVGIECGSTLERLSNTSQVAFFGDKLGTAGVIVQNPRPGRRIYTVIAALKQHGE